jgi:hypothetical protein
MRKWLGWALLGGFATAVGCGGSDGTSVQNGDDSGSSGDDANGGDDASIPTFDGGHDGSGSDATVGDDAGGSNDATLDITFPDSFTMPDTASVDSAGVDSASEAGCAPNGVTCTGNVATTCTNGVTTVATCSGGTPICADGFGCVVCSPGSGSCNGSVGTVCKSDGSGYQTNNCDPLLGITCSGGFCQGDCANIGSSYIGCEYYAVTMSNSQLDQVTFYFSASISNTGTSTANINITGPSGFVLNDTIVAGGIKEYQLPWVPALSKTGASTTQKVAGGAYHIRSTEPVTVYQFNPRDYTRNGTNSYTNDASLLLPVNAMTSNYYVAGGATWGFSGQNFPGTVAIIGTVDNTTVTYAIPPGNPIIAGAGMATTGGSFTINHGDVVQIASAANAPVGGFGSDQSGARITATQPVEVFGGTDCTNMPASIQYCDHIEEVVFPLETLRNDYLVVRPYNQNATPRNYVKLIGTQAGTTITTSPTGLGAPATLGAGQVAFFEVQQDFRVTASAPIIVGQYMEGQNNFGGGCFDSQVNATCGDPAMTVAVATAQFRTTYQFVAPPTYGQNWVNVIAPNGAAVTIDGVAVPAGTAIGASGYWAQKVSLCVGACTGVHKAAGNVPFGISVYGYGQYTSYWYPGGLDLKRQ